MALFFEPHQWYFKNYSIREKNWMNFFVEKLDFFFFFFDLANGASWNAHIY